MRDPLLQFTERLNWALMVTAAWCLGYGLASLIPISMPRELMATAITGTSICAGIMVIRVWQLIGRKIASLRGGERVVFRGISARLTA